MKMVSRHLTVIQERTWNYEYDTNEEFTNHKETMKQKGALIELSHTSKSGKIIATYIKRDEEDYNEHF